MTKEQKPRHSDDRHAEELAWIAKNRPYLWEHHAGQWICVQGSELISVADTPAEARKLARQKGISDPLVTAVRAKEYQGVILVRRV